MAEVASIMKQEDIGGAPPNIRVIRPYRIVEPRDPIRWGEEAKYHNPKTEYTEKYLQRVGRYRKMEPIMPTGQIAPQIGEFDQKPSVYKEDFITLDTAKPPVHRPIQSLQFGPEPPGTQRVSTYKDTYPKILAYQKRQAIPNRADHWIDKPEKVYGDTTTTYERSFLPHFGESRRTLMKKEIPFMEPDVGFARDTTHKSDLKEYDSEAYKSARLSFRPQYVATIPAPFDSQSENRLKFIPYDGKHYLAAFDDLCNPQIVRADSSTARPRGGAGASADGGGDIDQISKRGKGPPSPQVPADIEAMITARTVGNLGQEGNMKSGRLEALKQKSSGKSRPPNFATTYRRSFNAGSSRK